MISGAYGPTWDELCDYLDDSVLQLPESLKLPIILHYLEGRSGGEIAAELETNSSEVPRLLETGLKELRRNLAADGMAVSLETLDRLLVAHALVSTPPSLAAPLAALVQSEITASTSFGRRSAASNTGPWRLRNADLN